MMPSCMDTSTHMLWACMTVCPWSMIQPSKAGSAGTQGVAKPQPATDAPAAALEHGVPRSSRGR